ATPFVLAEFGTSTSRDNILTFESISIAPNPTQDGAWLTLDNRQAGKYLLKILNATGQLLQKQDVTLVNGRQTHWIDLSDLPRGLYFMQLSIGQQLLTKKILKQ